MFNSKKWKYFGINRGIKSMINYKVTISSTNAYNRRLYNIDIGSMEKILKIEPGKLQRLKPDLEIEEYEKIVKQNSKIIEEHYK